MAVLCNFMVERQREVQGVHLPLSMVYVSMKVEGEGSREFGKEVGRGEGGRGIEGGREEGEGGERDGEGGRGGRGRLLFIPHLEYSGTCGCAPDTRSAATLCPAAREGCENKGEM